jgi:hypothetical protein
LSRIDHEVAGTSPSVTAAYASPTAPSKDGDRESAEKRPSSVALLASRKILVVMLAACAGEQRAAAFIRRNILNY